MAESVCVAGIQISQSRVERTQQLRGQNRATGSFQWWLAQVRRILSPRTPKYHRVMSLPTFHLDAFAGKPFAGNPAAVCPLAGWLDDGLPQAVAVESNLSETAFFVPADAPLRLAGQPRRRSQHDAHGTSPLLRRNSWATSFTSLCWPSRA